MVINLRKLFEFLYENGFRYVAMDTNRDYEISAFVSKPIRITRGDDILYENGFCYVARGDDDYLSATAFINEPEWDKQQFDGIYWDPRQGDEFVIDLDFRNTDTFPVERGHYMEISDLLSRQEEDAVNHPKYYQLPSGRESIEVMKEVLTDEEYRGWCKGNALKYIFREGKKDDAAQDIEKARKFLEFLTEEQ